MSQRIVLWLTLFVFWFPSLVGGQGLLVDSQRSGYRLPRPIWPGPRPIPRPRPEPTTSYKIKDLTVNATLTGQVAKVRVSQTFVNTGSTQMEVAFVFPLPYDGAVDGLTFMVDGKEYEGKLLDAKEARRIYESYIRRQKDPALLEWMGTGMFKTSVFPVPPGAERSVTLRYSQVCRMHDGLTEFLFPLSTAKYTSEPVESVQVNISIQSQAKIKNVYSPTHAVDIQRPGDLQAVVRYNGSQQVPQTDFRLFYDVGDQAVAASVLSYRPEADEDGYFLMLLSPEISQSGDKVVPKTVLLVVDRSGSMNGKKMEQAKEALRYVINNLREGDTFNIIAYDSVVESFRPELERYSDQTRQAALGFVNGIYAGGSTNIDGALKSAFAHLQDDSRPSYLIFLTDGIPTVGETKVGQIVASAREQNRARARLFAFGVGYDVNSHLLDKLAHASYGQSEYVRPSEDIEAHVSRLYDRIGSPVLTNVRIAVDIDGLRPEDGTAVNRVYPREAYDLFAGEQLLVVGRYAKPGAAKVTISGSVRDTVQTFDFPAPLIEQSKDETYAFIEKLWAVRRVGEIIDEIDLHGKNPELVDELVALATKHGILTPYTSFIADDNVSLGDLATTRAAADGALDRLSLEEGRVGFAQRGLKQELRRARLAAPAGAEAHGGYGAEPRNDRYADAYGGAARNSPALERVGDALKHVGAKTFFRRGNAWVDSLVVKENWGHAINIRRYSESYFDLVARYGRDASKYLALEGDIVVQLGGELYRVSDGGSGQ